MKRVRKWSRLRTHSIPECPCRRRRPIPPPLSPTWDGDHLPTPPVAAAGPPLPKRMHPDAGALSFAHNSSHRQPSRASRGMITEASTTRLKEESILLWATRTNVRSAGDSPQPLRDATLSWRVVITGLSDSRSSASRACAVYAPARAGGGVPMRPFQSESSTSVVRGPPPPVTSACRSRASVKGRWRFKPGKEGGWWHRLRHCRTLQRRTGLAG